MHIENNRKISCLIKNPQKKWFKIGVSFVLKKKWLYCYYFRGIIIIVRSRFLRLPIFRVDDGMTVRRGSFHGIIHCRLIKHTVAACTKETKGSFLGLFSSISYTYSWFNDPATYPWYCLCMDGTWKRQRGVIK